MKPTVEKLSDAAWSRVERDVFTRLDVMDRVEPARPAASPAHRRWWWLALPVALSAAAIVLVIVRTPGASRATDAEVEWSRVVSGAAPSSVTFSDAEIALDASSAVVLQRQVVRPVVWLERGAATFSVAPRVGREPFVVLAGDTMIRVVGTRFRVARYAERTVVAVERGVVEIQHRGEIAHVVAGQTWSSDPPAPSTAAPPSPVPSVPAAPSVAPAIPKPALVAPPASPARHEPPTESDQQRYEGFSQLEATQPDAAMRGYLELSQGSSRWAALALYSAGRLAADRKDPRAATFLTIYQHRFPAGANAADVKYLLDRLQGASR